MIKGEYKISIKTLAERIIKLFIHLLQPLPFFLVKLFYLLLNILFQICEGVWVVAQINLLEPDVNLLKMSSLFKPYFFLIFKMKQRGEGNYSFLPVLAYKFRKRDFFLFFLFLQMP